MELNNDNHRPKTPEMTQKTSPEQLAKLFEAAQPFEAWFAQLQGNFPESYAIGDDVQALVSSDPNQGKPIHRWYNLKESFAWSLPEWIVRWMETNYGHQAQVVLDSFLGSGTSGVSLSQIGLQVVGIEYNPFIRFVAAAKANTPLASAIELEMAIQELETPLPAPSKFPVPALTTLQNEKFVSDEDMQLLLSMRERINQMQISSSSRTLLLLGIAAAIEAAFNLRKDGRALRYVPKTAHRPLAEELAEHWRQILADVKSFQEKGQSPRSLYEVYAGSAKDLKTLRTLDGHDVSLRNQCFDTIIYSPPYLNNFDYSEVYKLELWILHFIESYEDWKNLRLGTIRSHHSISFPDTNYLGSDTRTQHIAQQITEMGDSICLPNSERVRIKRVITGYFDDMYQTLLEQWRVLKPGGVIAYVVANSRHYYLPVATDIMMGEIARCIGFEPLGLVVLKKRNGRTRQKLFLRESVVFIRKPLIVPIAKERLSD